MSVTFYAISGTGSHAITRMAKDADGDDYDSLELNVSNIRARELLAMLGIEPMEDLCGIISDVARIELLCRETLAVLRANPELDAGRTSKVVSGDGRCTMVLCAASDGYYTDRLERIRALAEAALLENGVIQFC